MRKKPTANRRESAPVPPFRAFRWRVGDEVDDLSRANRRFANLWVSCGGRGREPHISHPADSLFFVFSSCFREFSVMGASITDRKSVV